MARTLCELHEERINEISSQINKMKQLLWYCAGALSLQIGSQALPLVSALFLK